MSTLIENLDFTKGDGLIPGVIQDANTLDVLMLGYLNKESIKKTIETGFVTFYSRSKKRLWQKGETSGNKLKLISLSEDCDNDTLLIKAIPSGPVCHTGTKTCFKENDNFTLNSLERIIKDRKLNPNSESYVSSLLNKGIEKVAQKVGEEAVEVVIASLSQSKDELRGELADLFFHTLVLMQAKDVQLEDVLLELKRRKKG